MHPFCCVSPIADRNNNNHHPSLSPMPSQQPPSSAVLTAARPHSNGALLDPKHRININNNHNFNQNQSHNNHNLNQVTAVDQREVKINNLVGNGICGILYKWVNYGKGWRPRWFVLQDGVLSYYKIHGPDKITLSSETEKGSKVIGDESMRRIQRHKNSPPQLRRKAFGEIHLKVSSIRESRSDDKRFSIFTGTKRLHLRAETREDRAAWMDALQAVKDMFPRLSNSELMAPVDNAVVSTEKLRQRLLDEGVSEAAIQDSEQIMKTEFATLQNQLVLLKQKQWLLIDTLRQLEVHPKKTKNHHSNQFHHSSSVSPVQE